MFFWGRRRTCVGLFGGCVWVFVSGVRLRWTWLDKWKPKSWTWGFLGCWCLWVRVWDCLQRGREKRKDAEQYGSSEAICWILVQLGYVFVCFGAFYPRNFPQRGQNFASSPRTWPHFGHTLVIRLPRRAPGGVLSLTRRYRISPNMLRKNTIIAHSAPLIPRDSASRYTHRRIRIPTMNQSSGISIIHGRNQICNCWMGDDIILSYPFKICCWLNIKIVD